MGDKSKKDEVSPEYHSGEGPRRGCPEMDFNQALKWAQNDVKNKRQAGTWNAKFFYIIGAIIVLIIILGLIYIYYSKVNRCQNKPDLIDNVTEPNNCLPVSTNSSPSEAPCGTINSPGGTLLPAVENGVQTGWWLYPK